MKKYLICKKVTQLRMFFLASSLFIISSNALSDSEYYLTGKINEINIDGNFCAMKVINNEKTSRLNIENKGICDFAQNAKDFDTLVDFKYKMRNGYSNPQSRNEIVSVEYSGRQANWFNGDKSGDSNKYDLIGDVENVYYNKNGRCYVAVNNKKATNTNIFPDKYNKTFHETEDKSICKLAESAFYLGLKVNMNATVDKTENDYANNINTLNISNSCTKKYSSSIPMDSKIAKKRLITTLFQ